MFFGDLLIDKEVKYLYKKAIPILSILFAVILFFCSNIIPVSAYDISAEDAIITTEITPRFTTISSTTTSFNISGLNARIEVTLVSQYSTSLSIKVDLEKSVSGGYKVVDTWTKTGSGTIIELEQSKLINPLNNYRIKITCTAGSETTTLYRYPA